MDGFTDYYEFETCLLNNSLFSEDMFLNKMFYDRFSSEFKISPSFLHPCHGARSSLIRCLSVLSKPFPPPTASWDRSVCCPAVDLFSPAIDVSDV